MSAPIDLTVVLAVQRGVNRLPEVLAALAGEVTPNVELLVPYAEEDSEVESLCALHPFARPLRGAPGALTPELWRDGILAASGSRIALSIVHCRPAPGWIQKLLAADLATYAGIGGALSNTDNSDARGWAIYFLRYLRYAPPFARRETIDFPGDNAVYARDALLEHAEAFARDGFWENEIHPRLERAGRRLLIDPDLVAVHANGYSTLDFALQRFRHATRFGHARARAMSPFRRLLYLGSMPVVPALFGAKILREVLRRPEGRAHLMASAPYLAVFLEAWSLGEARGALQAVWSGAP